MVKEKRESDRLIEDLTHYEMFRSHSRAPYEHKTKGNYVPKDQECAHTKTIC